MRQFYLKWTGHVVPYVTSADVQMQKEVFPWHFCEIPLCRSVWKTTSRDHQNLFAILPVFYCDLLVLGNSRGNGLRITWWYLFLDNIHVSLFCISWSCRLTSKRANMNIFYWDVLVGAGCLKVLSCVSNARGVACKSKLLLIPRDAW